MGKSHKRKKSKENKNEKFFRKLKKMVDAMPDSSSDTDTESLSRGVMHTNVANSGEAASGVVAKGVTINHHGASTSRQGLSPANGENMENISPIAVDDQTRDIEGQLLVDAASQPAEDTVQSFDEETLRILGVDEKSGAPELQLHPTLAQNWEKWMAEGLKKDDQEELLAKYARTGNCRLEAPSLNAEVASSLFESATKRDKYLRNAQNIRGSAMAALGTGISLLLSPKDDGIDEYQLLECLADAGRLLAHAFRLDTITRRSCITPSLDKKVKGVLDETKPGAFLFGEDLSGKIKTAKSIEKVGLELKSQPSVPKVPLRNSNSGNWRGPSANSNRGGSRAGANQSGSRKLVKFVPKSNQSYQQRDQQRARSQSRKQNSYRGSQGKP